MSASTSAARTSPLVKSPGAIAPYFVSRQVESSAVRALREEIAALTQERDTLLERTAREIAEMRRATQAELEELRSICRREEAERARTELTDVLRGIVAAHQSLLREIEEETPALVLTLAQRVVGAELTGPGGGRAWSAILAEVLRETRAAGDLTLRVPPHHASAVREAMRDLTIGDLAGRSVEIVSDAALADGTCVIKPISGSIEVSIERAFEQAAAMLTDASKEPGRLARPFAQWEACHERS